MNEHAKQSFIRFDRENLSLLRSFGVDPEAASGISTGGDQRNTAKFWDQR